MKPAWILLIAGILFFILSSGVAFVSLLLPALTNGRTDMEEAMLGIVPGSCCSMLSILMIMGAVIWMVVSSRKP